MNFREVSGRSVSDQQLDGLLLNVWMQCEDLPSEFLKNYPAIGICLLHMCLDGVLIAVR